jgi:hypothetical protein
MKYYEQNLEWGEQSIRMVHTSSEGKFFDDVEIVAASQADG